MSVGTTMHWRRFWLDVAQYLRAEGNARLAKQAEKYAVWWTKRIPVGGGAVRFTFADHE